MVYSRPIFISSPKKGIGKNVIKMEIIEFNKCRKKNECESCRYNIESHVDGIFHQIGNFCIKYKQILRLKK